MKEALDTDRLVAAVLTLALLRASDAGPLTPAHLVNTYGRVLDALKAS